MKALKAKCVLQQQGCVFRRQLHICLTGIGNPEPQYQFTRHNAGLVLLDMIKEHYLPNHPWRQCTIPKVAAKFCHDIKNDMLFLRSDGDYINRSGHNILPIWKKVVPIKTCFVVHDELSLPFGKVQLRLPGRSIRGHNGLRDIVAKVGPHIQFHCLAIGIGRPASRDPETVAQYVLQRLTTEELATLKQLALPAALQKMRHLAFPGHRSV
ncbi:aminoacyl-tRNA hydrolase Ecym_1391 [Eremothecium cymbalariae DBVPG|uniref:Peptidyl-tRNA hydrolase n=1 Tax=Eremothecium cymbalariae (strain CBS 270.75 / DBVPG 7215 / KCTC 17166 / NRRL Y-17582) TaxID=931890 RepID=G8JM50_ERECY|nr:hypothetical protein Ecym_1391 [Eremothecium cymbalariae DBVPG\